MRKQKRDVAMKTALSFLLLAIAGAPADAQTGYAPPRLKPQVTVSADVVLIGDLIENAGIAANTPVKAGLVERVEDFSWSPTKSASTRVSTRQTRVSASRI